MSEQSAEYQQAVTDATASTGACSQTDADYQAAVDSATSAD